MMRVHVAVAVVVAMAMVPSVACTTVIVGKNVSTTGRVLVGHTEDSDSIRMDHALVPACDWPVGAKLPCEPGCAILDQVPHTFAFYWSESISSAYVPVPCNDTMANEKGVYVTANYGGSSPFSLQDAGLVKGGIRNLLFRVVAERATSARHGMEIAVGLLDRYGLARASGWIWTIADKDEAWVIQALTGHRWATLRVPDDRVAVISNILTPRKLPCAGFDAAHSSADVRGGIDDFSKRYQGADWFMHPHSVSRYRLAAAILTARQPFTDEVEFSLRPARAVSPEMIRKILSTHVVEGKDAHVDDVGPICRCETVEATVVVFGPTVPQLTLHVTARSPCCHPWNTWRPFGEGLPPSVLVKNPTKRLAEQYSGRAFPTLAD